MCKVSEVGYGTAWYKTRRKLVGLGPVSEEHRGPRGDWREVGVRFRRVL